MDDVIILISDSYTTDAYGVRRKTETQRQVFAKVRSVTRAEFFEGGRNGLNPQYRFDVFKGDYDGETVIEYSGKRYGVYRVYQPETAEGRYVSRTEDTDYIELYVERKGGTNVTQSSSG